MRGQGHAGELTKGGASAGGDDGTDGSSDDDDGKDEAGEDEADDGESLDDEGADDGLGPAAAAPAGHWERRGDDQGDEAATNEEKKELMLAMAIGVGSQAGLCKAYLHYCTL